MPTLSSPNIVLRPLEQDDLDILVEWRNAPENWGQFFNKFPLSRGGQRGFFESLLKSQSKKLFIIWSHSGERIGTIGFDDLDLSNQSTEYGSVMIASPAHRNKGLGEEATRLLLNYCFDTLNITRVWLRVFADNAAAIRLYEKCGFQHEGILRKAIFSEARFRDVAVMAIVRR